MISPRSRYMMIIGSDTMIGKNKMCPFCKCKEIEFRYYSENPYEGGFYPRDEWAVGDNSDWRVYC